VLLGKTLEEGETRREDAAGNLTVVGSSLVKENRTAGARANGTAGSQKQYGRYFIEPNTLNGQPIPEEDDPRR
jgi:hypothetical protein